MGTSRPTAITPAPSLATPGLPPPPRLPRLPARTTTTRSPRSPAPTARLREFVIFYGI